MGKMPTVEMIIRMEVTPRKIRMVRRMEGLRGWEDGAVDSSEGTARAER